MKTGKDRPAQQPPKPRCVHRMLEGQCAICSDLAPRRGPAEVSPAAARPATASTTTATAPTTKAGPPPLPMAERIRSAARRAEERRGTTTATAAARVLLVLRRRVVLLRAERRELSRQWARAERMRDLLARAGL